MLNKALKVTCDKCGVVDILEKKSNGPSNSTDMEGYEKLHAGWNIVMRLPHEFTEKRHLCPSCSKRYSELIESFWRRGCKSCK